MVLGGRGQTVWSTFMSLILIPETTGCNEEYHAVSISQESIIMGYVESSKPGREGLFQVTRDQSICLG